MLCWLVGVSSGDAIRVASFQQDVKRGVSPSSSCSLSYGGECLHRHFRLRHEPEMSLEIEQRSTMLTFIIPNLLELCLGLFLPFTSFHKSYSCSCCCFFVMWYTGHFFPNWSFACMSGGDPLNASQNPLARPPESASCA